MSILSLHLTIVLEKNHSLCAGHPTRCPARTADPTLLATEVPQPFVRVVGRSVVGLAEIVEDFEEEVAFGVHRQGEQQAWPKTCFRDTLATAGVLPWTRTAPPLTRSVPAASLLTVVV